MRDLDLFATAMEVGFLVRARNSMTRCLIGLSDLFTLAPMTFINRMT